MFFETADRLFCTVHQWRRQCCQHKNYLSSCAFMEAENLPQLPQQYLELKFLNNNEDEIEGIPRTYPFAASDVFTENIVNAEKLTIGDDVKEIYSIEFNNRQFLKYQPGDTVGIVTENRQEDIDALFNHLGIADLATKKIIISKCPDSSKKVQQNQFLLDKVTTLTDIFKSSLDVHCIPRKLLIRVLAHYTKSLREKKFLEKLCSKEGSDLYLDYIFNANKTFLDLLLMYPTCQPPVIRLIENMPNLLPRPYSVVSSPITSPNSITIVFSVVKFSGGSRKEGLCTGMLKKKVLEKKMSSKIPTISFFMRKSCGFNLPDDDKRALILIGPGTGIAPFIGFLEHRKAQSRQFGKVWLFYGCKYKSKDFLFKKKLETFIDCNVLTKLLVAFSRENALDDNECARPKYVQDNLKKYGDQIMDLIFEENAVIYVCGDAKNMRKDVENAFREIFQIHKGMTSQEATDFVKKLQKEKRYLQDIWL